MNLNRVSCIALDVRKLTFLIDYEETYVASTHSYSKQLCHSPLRNSGAASDSQETPRSLVWSSGVVEFRHSSPPLVFNEQL